ncbi:hypothetical protein GWI33_015370 [Rhynchophorus ferrugineus]|uniref:Uncharacterized protein n=1 Tax=Rhynchophorus ferrugineus TaxID=354439 RepID=A0A834M858_RHYFE|nr:hypothetical protein GWI33_015370 [Rhynchophorus ferrugineus]
MIRHFLVPEMKKQELEDTWFYSDLAWPPGLAAPDFFLWNFLKSKVYRNKPQTIQHLKDNIRHKIEEIQPQMLQDVMKRYLKKAKSCIANGCHHLADILFQS